MKKIGVLLICLLCIQVSLSAQTDRKKNRKKNKEDITLPKAPEIEKSDIKSIEEVTEKCKKIEGLFTIYQDTTVGKTYLEISEDQIGDEIIYFQHYLNGFREASAFKGAYGSNRIFKIEKYYDKILLVEQNTKYYFDPENAISKAAEANINEPVVLAEKIIGEETSKDSTKEKSTSYLISSDKIFLTEAVNQIKSSPRPGGPPSFNLGKLNSSKTRYKAISSYPENTDVIVEYGFDNPYPSAKVSAGDAVTNPRHSSLTIQHSFIAVPDNDYQPRFEDSRVGYFTDKITDLTSASVTPYRDVINRWHLKKKNPEEAISEPVEPIVWWIENTTPEDMRDIIKEGAVKWNEAFMKAGFKNALVVKVQPDTADWDAGDIRYNVLRWTSSPNPLFGGYGPCFTNPKTGQILGADIMLEYVYLTNRLRFEKVFDLAALNLMEDIEAELDNDPNYCTAGLHALQENIFGVYALSTQGLGDIEKSKLLNQGLQRLILHELGHTLGLTHNFCASQQYTIDEMNDPSIGGKYGIASSVMDYHATNIALSPEKQGDYAIHQPGAYDEWAIQYGYTEWPTAGQTEEGLDALLSRSTEHDLCYGNDADDVRSPGRGIDPRFNVSDLGKDAIAFSLTRIQLVEQTMPKLKDNVLESGDSYHELRSAYLTLTGNYSGALSVISKYIGGIYIDRARVGQETDRKPFTPVPYDEQKRAMNALAKYGFSPEAFQFDNEMISYLKMQRRGFGFRGSGGEDPKIHSRVLNMQKTLLSQLLHQDILERLTDTELYGNKYSTAEMLSDLSEAIFKADLKTDVNGYRQNLQIEYVNRLANILDSKSYDYIAQSAALNELTKIKSMEQKATSVSESTKAHRKHIVFAIDKVLETN